MDAILVSPHQVARLEEHLLLIRRILREAAPPPRRRGWLLEQCRRRGDDERDLWLALARYQQTGAAGLLTGTWRRPPAFGRQDALVRERLLPLLLDSPPCMLEQFGLLAPLLQELADRLSFLCAQLGVEVVPRTRDAARHSEADHLEVVLDVLLQKIAEEVERLRETCSRPAGLYLHEACETTAIICCGAPQSAITRTSNERRHRTAPLPTTARGRRAHHPRLPAPLSETGPRGLLFYRPRPTSPRVHDPALRDKLLELIDEVPTRSVPHRHR